MGLVYIYLHENHKNQPNVGKYTSPMDGMGTNLGIPWGISMFFFRSSERAITWILFVLVGKAGFENLNTNNAAPKKFRKVNHKFI